MSRFYIQTQPANLNEEVQVYELTCTSDLDIAFTGRPTMNPVEANVNISDHYQKDNISLTFQGIITDIGNIFLPPENQRTVEANFKGLREIYESGNPFTVHFDDSQPALSNCVFTNLNFVKSSGMDTAYRVTMAMQQIQISSIAQLVAIPEQTEDIANQHGSKRNGGDNNTKEVLPENLVIKGVEGGISLFSNNTEDGS